LRDGIEYPSRRFRIDDILDILSTRGQFQIRGSTAASHERLGLTEEAANSITVRAGTSTLLDLLLGDADASGREINMRRRGSDEVRSGVDRLSVYVNSHVTAWFDLSLFPDLDMTSADLVQSLVIYPLHAHSEDEDENEHEAPVALMRSGSGWIISGVENPDVSRADFYIRSVLDSTGIDFRYGESFIAEGGVVMELGDGRRVTLTVGPFAEGTNHRIAELEGYPFQFLLSDAVIARIFRPASFFERQ
jgi:hypothetical protein